MTRALVTGATGFVGYHVARVLKEKGFEVRGLVRDGTDAACLRPIDVETVQGDVRDHDSVYSAVRGCDQVYHVAADYRLWVPDPEPMYQVNVRGTTTIMEASLRYGVEKVVYTSTSGILSPAANGKPSNEEAPSHLCDMVGHYKRSKFLAEGEVRRFVRKGLPAVIVNPTAPIGTMDRKPTPTGKIVVDFLNGKMPAYLDTGLNFVDVEDVALGHWLAAVHGRVGERYILGNANLSLQGFLKVLARLTGKKAPRWKLPYTPVLCAAFVDETLSKLAGGRQPLIPVTGVRMARHYMFFDCSKAAGELGMPQNSLEIAAEKAINWYIKHGYVRNPFRKADG